MFFITDKFPDTEGLCFYGYSRNKEKLEKLLNDRLNPIIIFGVNPNNLKIKEFKAYNVTEIQFNNNIVDIMDLENISINSDFKLNIGNKSFLFEVLTNDDPATIYRSFHIHLNNDKSVEYLVSLNLQTFEYFKKSEKCLKCRGCKQMGYCNNTNHGISKYLSENKFYDEGMLNEN